MGLNWSGDWIDSRYVSIITSVDHKPGAPPDNLRQNTNLRYNLLMSQIAPPSTKPQEQEKPPVPAYLALVGGLLIIGLSAILIRAANAPGPVTGFYRMAIGFVILTGMVTLRRKQPRFTRQGLYLSALAGLALGIDMTFWTTGIMLAGPTKPTLLGNTTPLWVGLATMLIYKEKHPPQFWVGLIVALSGAAFIVGSDMIFEDSLDVGTLLGMVSAVFYSAYFMIMQRARSSTDALTSLWVITFFTGVVCLLASLLLGHPLSGFDQRTILIFFTTGILIQVIAWLLITYAQGHIPASVVSPTLLGQPVLTAIFAVPLLGERLDKIDYLGGVAVLGGVLLVHFSKQKNKKQALT